jgi:hypothetical protein
MKVNGLWVTIQAMSFSPSKIRELANDSNPASLSNRMRSRRFQLFESLTAKLAKPLRILDVGGTNEFWERRGWAGRGDVTIFILNHQQEQKRHSNIYPVTGDARDLSEYADGSFDIAFSNSVIEHLFSLENQRRMAKEMRRVGKALWVQTPNYWFPIEPHFHVLGWQWIPVGVRVAIIRRWRCGWRGPCPDPGQAKQIVTEVRLLKADDLKAIFPGAQLVPEIFARLVKSWIVIDGFPS